MPKKQVEEEDVPFVEPTPISLSEDEQGAVNEEQMRYRMMLMETQIQYLEGRLGSLTLENHRLRKKVDSLEH